MKFTTGTKQINDSSFTVKRSKDESLEMNYNVEIGETVNGETLYHNVPGKEVKIGESVYTQEGNFLGYRAE